MATISNEINIELKINIKLKSLINDVKNRAQSLLLQEIVVRKLYPQGIYCSNPQFMIFSRTRSARGENTSYTIGKNNYFESQIWNGMNWTLSFLIRKLILKKKLRRENIAFPTSKTPAIFLFHFLILRWTLPTNVKLFFSSCSTNENSL